MTSGTKTLKAPPTVADLARQLRETRAELRLFRAKSRMMMNLLEEFESGWNASERLVSALQKELLAIQKVGESA
jgi:hypothetical protein